MLHLNQRGAVLLRVVSAPVGAIVTGISRCLFPLISELFKEVKDEGLELNNSSRVLHGAAPHHSVQ